MSARATVRGHPRAEPARPLKTHDTAPSAMMIQAVDDRAMIREADEADGRMLRRDIGAGRGGRWGCILMRIAVEDEVSVRIDERARGAGRGRGPVGGAGGMALPRPGGGGLPRGGERRGRRRSAIRG